MRLREMESKNNPPPPQDPDDDEPLEDLITKDPDKALSRWMKQRGFVDRFERMEQTVGESMYSAVAAEIPEFEEYEDDVREIIKKSGAAATRENIQGALSMAIGQRQLMERMQGRRASTSDNGAPPPDDGKGGGGTPEDKFAWSDTEEQVRIGLGIPKEKWAAGRSEGSDRPQFQIRKGRK